jgi:hypothetical protein
MAISSNQALKHLRGHIGRLLVIRYYAKADRIVVSAFPQMDKVVFSKSQLANQSKFKKAVQFATKIKSCEMLSHLFKQALGNEISVYKEAMRQYFKNPEAPLNFILGAKMQGSPKDDPTLALPSCPEERLKLAEKYLAQSTSFPATPKTTFRARRHNPNYRKYALLMQGELA